MAQTAPMQGETREAALRETEAHVRLILDGALDAVVSTDAADVITYWNPQAEKTFGWTADEALGQRFGELILPPDASGWACPSSATSSRCTTARWRPRSNGRDQGSTFVVRLPAVDTSADKVPPISMRDEDGYDLIRKVRALPPESGGRTPAAALTAYGRLEDRMKALSAGFQLHVAKPVDPAELVAVVAMLGGRT